MWQDAKRGQPGKGGDAGRMPELAGLGQSMALAMTLMAMTQRPVRPQNLPPASAGPVEAAVTDAAVPVWRDEVSYTLDPGEGGEVKLVPEAGQVARFIWTANRGVVNFDQHGGGSGQEISHEQSRAVAEASGDLTAAFSGNHGWFWRNRRDASAPSRCGRAGTTATSRHPERAP